MTPRPSGKHSAGGAGGDDGRGAPTPLAALPTCPPVCDLPQRMPRFRRRVLRELAQLQHDVRALLDLHTQERTRWEIWGGRVRLAGLLFYRTVVVIGFGGLFLIDPALAKMISTVIARWIP